jgi:hypothetical protein
MQGAEADSGETLEEDKVMKGTARGLRVTPNPRRTDPRLAIVLEVPAGTTPSGADTDKGHGGRDLSRGRDGERGGNPLEIESP